MAAIGSPHGGCVNRMNRIFVLAAGDRAVVAVQNPITLDPHSEPQPDLSVLKPRADFYASAHPAPGNVLLVVEVADTSLGYDRHVKVPLYARAAIGETWLVDLLNERVEVFTEPTPQGYRSSRQARRGERLPSHVLPEASLLVDRVLGE